MDPISEYLLRASAVLLRRYPTHFEGLDKDPRSTAVQSGDAQPSIVRESAEPDWYTEAIDAPVGSLPRLHEGPAIRGRGAWKGFPPSWIRHAEELLFLRGSSPARACNVCIQPELVFCS